MKCDRDCPISMPQAGDDCFWVTVDKGCRMKAEREQRRLIQASVDSDYHKAEMDMFNRVQKEQRNDPN